VALYDHPQIFFQRLFQKNDVTVLFSFSPPEDQVIKRLLLPKYRVQRSYMNL